MTKEANGMSEAGLILMGVEGLVANHIFYLKEGFEGNIGRSRQCEVCLKDAPGYVNISAEEKEQEDLVVLISSHLRAALRHIGSATGRVYEDELLDNIFSRFCVGK